MPLEITSLKMSVSALSQATEIARKRLAENKLPLAELNLMRAGVIQHFEFTYELCWKYMKRWLRENAGPGAVDGIPRRELFRLAAEYGLIEDVEAWMEYHRARNLISHTYDQEVAAEIYNVALRFAEDANRFRARLEEKNA